MQTRIRTVNQKPIYVWQDVKSSRAYLSEKENASPTDAIVLDPVQVAKFETNLETFLTTERAQKFEYTLDGVSHNIQIDKDFVTDGTHKISLDTQDKRWVAQTMRPFASLKK